MIKQIFIINGSGGVGKDTFTEVVKSQASIKNIKVGNYSSVSKVKEVAKIIGWNGSKSERDRKFLSDLKLLTTEYNDMALNDMKEFANNFMNIANDGATKVLFLHIREPKEIKRASREFAKIGYDVKTILVRRDSVKHITSNIADKDVYNYHYDVIINNNGDFATLQEIANDFIDDFKI